MATKNDHAGLVKLLRSMIHQKGSQRAVARLLGISDSYLSDVLNGKRTPTAGKIHGALKRYMQQEKG